MGTNSVRFGHSSQSSRAPGADNPGSRSPQAAVSTQPRWETPDPQPGQAAGADQRASPSSDAARKPLTFGFSLPVPGPRKRGRDRDDSPKPTLPQFDQPRRSATHPHKRPNPGHALPNPTLPQLDPPRRSGTYLTAPVPGKVYVSGEKFLATEPSWDDKNLASHHERHKDDTGLFTQSAYEGKAIEIHASPASPSIPGFVRSGSPGKDSRVVRYSEPKGGEPDYFTVASRTEGKIITMLTPRAGREKFHREQHDAHETNKNRSNASLGSEPKQKHRREKK